MIKNNVLIIISILLCACSTTKHLDTNEYILKKNTITLNGKNGSKYPKNISKKDIHGIIKQKPNKKMIGLIPFHLWLYQLSKPAKNNWINNYLRKIGEAPSITNSELTKKSVLQIKSHFENNGYFTSTVKSDTKYRNKKAYVNYSITTGDLYLINNIDYADNNNKVIQELIEKNRNESAIKKGDIFTYTGLNNERIRIESLFQNNGYYKFSKDYIYVKADSTNNNLVDVNFSLEQTSDSTIYKKFTISNIVIQITEPKNKLTDTLEYNNYQFITGKKSNLKLNIISDLITIKKGAYYSQENTIETYENLSNLAFFKKLNIDFVEQENTNKLDCYIEVVVPTKMYYSVEAEAKRSTDEGNISVSSHIQFGNNNLFKGAENLNGKIRASLGNRQASTNQSDKLFNTKEISYEIGLRKPKLILPKKMYNWLQNSFQMNTNFIFSITQRERPDFSSQTITQKWGYSWKNSIDTQHQLNLIELSFADIEQNTFISNLIQDNIYLREQFQDKFIPASKYTFTFNNQRNQKFKNYTFLKTEIETSGNLFQLLGELGGLQIDNDNYLFFNNPFSQYAKINFDIRKYFMMTENSTLILRNFLGTGYAYGNSEKLPIQKQFFSGGVNSIRAWEAFSLGPGSFKDTTNNNYATGDLKIEFNIEYRFTFFNSLKSAIFVDAGNIWTIKEDERMGSNFKINSFLHEFAIGAGIGFRYDFDFFVIRLDMAKPLRDPTYPENDRWVKNTLNNGKFRYNLAIGYPF